MTKTTKTKRCGQDQEMRKSSGKLGVGAEAGGATAMQERGSPPSSGEIGSAGGDSCGWSNEECAGKFSSGGLGGLSSKRLIVFQCGVSWASQRPARQRRAAKAARGAR